MNDRCPGCGSDNFEDNAEGVITPGEIKQDFVCGNCSLTWTVTYAPISVDVHEATEDEDPN